MPPICARETTDPVCFSLENMHLNATPAVVVVPKDGEARVEEKDGTGETGLVRQESDGLTEARQDGDGEQAGEEGGRGPASEDGSKKANKPCLIRLFKGSELDENYVYTDHDMVSLISRIVSEDVDCFEIEEVQTVIEFLREQVRDTSGEETDGRVEPEMMTCTAIKTGELSSSETPPASNEPQITTSEREAPIIPAVSHVTAVEEQAQISADAGLITSAALDPAKYEPAAAHDAEKASSGAAQALPKAEGKCAHLRDRGGGERSRTDMKSFWMHIEAEGMEVAHKKGGGVGIPPASRRKVAPLDLSMVETKAWTADHKTKSGINKTGQPTPLKSAALWSPCSLTQLIQALESLKELYRRHGKDSNNVQRPLAANPFDEPAISAFCRSSHSPLRQQSPLRKQSPLRQQSPVSATRVY
ncbi:hypothetical protein VP01_230g12 [Puccinia sorghi]|uniref:Uncharacterized protein n=1 Tax=Puccinia sorghi TaxID=27349 RepID=A0A0L6V7W9_9BASI|nr:hypothetical protein VP01_230g12 [Puccinia sorghi]